MATAVSLAHLGSLMRGVRTVDQVGAEERAAALSKRSVKKSSKLWALDLAIRHGVTVYDGLYLALATGSGCRLVTADRRLHEACRKGPLRHLVDWVREIP